MIAIHLQYATISILINNFVINILKNGVINIKFHRIDNKIYQQVIIIYYL